MEVKRGAPASRRRGGADTRGRGESRGRGAGAGLAHRGGPGGSSARLPRKILHGASMDLEAFIKPKAEKGKKGKGGGSKPAGGLNPMAAGFAFNPGAATFVPGGRPPPVSRPARDAAITFRGGRSPPACPGPMGRVGGIMLLPGQDLCVGRPVRSVSGGARTPAGSARPPRHGEQHAPRHRDPGAHGTICAPLRRSPRTIAETHRAPRSLSWRVHPGPGAGAMLPLRPALDASRAPAARGRGPGIHGAPGHDIRPVLAICTPSRGRRLANVPRGERLSPPRPDAPPTPPPCSPRAPLPRAPPPRRSPRSTWTSSRSS